MLQSNGVESPSLFVIALKQKSQRQIQLQSVNCVIHKLILSVLNNLNGWLSWESALIWAVYRLERREIMMDGTARAMALTMTFLDVFARAQLH